MTWAIEFSDQAKKELSKLDKPIAKKVIQFLKERILPAENPRLLGKALKGSHLGDFWRYRIGDCRIIVSIEDKIYRILVLRVGHRKDIYDR